MKHYFSLSQMSVAEVMTILKEAQECATGIHEHSEKNKMIANLFFEPSTRTQYSFCVAEERLGCKAINFQPESSSLKKGESFYDTVKTFESFGVDALVIRSAEEAYYKQLIDSIKIPMINAGDGTKDHPTQSLLDLLTIYQEFHRFQGLKIGIIGDIKHSRVAHSNMEIMQRLGMEPFISGPEEYRDNQYSFLPFEEALKTMDIIMLLRIQHERHTQEMSLTKEHYHQTYGITLERVKQMKPSAIIMHPGPFNRNVELADEVVECETSRINTQVRNGVYVRMAILKRALAKQ